MVASCIRDANAAREQNITFLYWVVPYHPDFAALGLDCIMTKILQETVPTLNVQVKMAWANKFSNIGAKLRMEYIKFW